jgi:uncharacterized protein YggE
MDTLQKKLLGWGGIVLMVIVGVLLIVITNQQFNTATTTNTVTFSGQGKVLAKPDVAVIDFSIVTESATSKAAQDDNSKKSKAVTDFLASQGIDAKDIKTTGYNIYPQYDYNNGKSTLRSYQVNQTTEVKVRDLTKTDDVLTGVVSAGANQVNQFQLTIDKPEQLQEQARQDAIKDAQAKAKVLEDQLGIRLGRIVNFTEDNGGYVPRPMYMMDSAKAVGMGGGAVAPEVSAGQNEISSNISITYQIK